MYRQTNKITLNVKFDESAEVFRLNVWKRKERKKKRTEIIYVQRMLDCFFFFFFFVEHWLAIRLWCVHYFLVASNSMRIIINHESKVIQFWFLFFSCIRKNLCVFFHRKNIGHSNEFWRSKKKKKKKLRRKWIIIDVLILYVELCASECFSAMVQCISDDDMRHHQKIE